MSTCSLHVSHHLTYLICYGFMSFIRFSMVICLGLAGFFSETRSTEAEFPPISELEFLSTWKLLEESEKKQFISGYLFGWRGTKRATEVVLEFTRENPDSALAAFETIRELYETDGITSDMVVGELDLYFMEAEGKAATLSQAVTTVRSKLNR